MARQTKSQKIRVLLAQGKTVKEVSKLAKCNPGLVYQVRSYDKRKAEKAKKWKSGVTVTSSTSAMKTAQKRLQQAAGVPIEPYKPGYKLLIQPKDYPMPKRNIVQRFFNWLCGG